MKPASLCALLTCFLSVIPLSQGDDAIPLETVPTLEEALALSQQDGKHVFLLIKARNCDHCRRFEKMVLRSSDFRNYSAGNLHLVIYDHLDRGGLSDKQSAELKTLMRKHKVRFTPTILVFSTDGEQLLRTEGYGGTPGAQIVSQLDTLRQHTLRRDGPDHPGPTLKNPIEKPE